MCVCVCVCVCSNHADYPGLDDIWLLTLMTTTVAYARLDGTSAGGVSPQARSGHVIAAVGKNVFLHGGIGQGYLSDLWKFCTETFDWTELVDIGTPGIDAPCARSGHVMAVVDNDLFLHGGHGASDDLDVWMFSIKHLKWTRLVTQSAGAIARNNHVMSAVGRDLFLHGGQGGMMFGKSNACRAAV